MDRTWSTWQQTLFPNFVSLHHDQESTCLKRFIRNKTVAEVRDLAVRFNQGSLLLKQKRDTNNDKTQMIKVASKSVRLKAINPFSLNPHARHGSKSNQTYDPQTSTV